MTSKFIPVLLRHSPTPKVEHFAILAGLDAAVRGMLISVMPLVIYDAVKDAGVVSRIYFVVGILSLIWGLMMPWITSKVPRRWMYSFGAALYPLGMVLAIHGSAVSVPLSILCNALASVTLFVCLNAYVLDYVSRAELGRGQSLQMVYAATPWMIGPVLGVWLHEIWGPLPFVIAAGFSVCLLISFWILRLGNGKQISRAKAPAVNPLAYLGRFFQQPRLIAGWLFAVVRSCGWWIYIVYLPIFCVQSGLGDKVGGVVLSASNSLLFISPFMLRFVNKSSLRKVIRYTLFWCALTFILAGVLAVQPWVAVALLFVGSVGLVMLDAAGGLPFMMSVKPSERAEMAAVYSCYRDFSGIVTPGVAYLVLLVAPIAAIFAAGGAGFVIAFAIAGRMHPRLGAARPSRGGGQTPGASISQATAAQ